MADSFVSNLSASTHPPWAIPQPQKTRRVRGTCRVLSHYFPDTLSCTIDCYRSTLTKRGERELSASKISVSFCMQCATKICLRKQQKGRTLAKHRLEKDCSTCVRGGINASKKRGKDVGGPWWLLEERQRGKSVLRDYCTLRMDYGRAHHCTQQPRER